MHTPIRYQPNDKTLTHQPPAPPFKKKKKPKKKKPIEKCNKNPRSIHTKDIHMTINSIQQLTIFLTIHDIKLVNLLKIIQNQPITAT